MDTVVILGILFLIVGIAGIFLPLVPGPILSLVGLFFIHYSDPFNIPTYMLVIASLLTLASVAGEYLFPVFSAKKFGGSNAGIWGATIGLLLGPFMLPFAGFIIGPAIGAFIGEYMQNKDDVRKAMQASLGTLIGFFMGIGLKLLAAVAMLFMAVWAMV